MSTVLASFYSQADNSLTFHKVQ